MQNEHLLDNFYVITMISNPIRYQSRWNLYKKFERHIHALGGKLYTIEVAFGHRRFEITQDNNPRHIQLRTYEELWHKENALNLAINRLPASWEYLAWIDADLVFSREDILLETVQQLQHYHIVQMWSHAMDLGPNFELIATHQGFAYSYHNNMCYPPNGGGYGGYYNNGNVFWHPGYAWACDRYAMEAMGQLLDTAILGAADHHMSLALIGQAHRSIPANVSPRYKYEIDRWQDRVVKHLKKDIGYVPGVISHSWHGKKKDRKYIERWDIITKNKFDPGMDMKRDSQGLYQLETNTPRQIRMRDDIRAYFRQRSEDSIDVE